MNVLSLFDGGSCGQIALSNLGIECNYYASEIDKNAIQATMRNYPKTIQLGDVSKISSTQLPQIDLLIGGSPCQGFSFAGKQLNFNDDRSKLFFEYVRLIIETKPKFFLLENVVMKDLFSKTISSILGVNYIQLNSRIFSAHDRKRLYWTNIDFPMIPSKNGPSLKSILEPNVAERYFLSKEIADRYVSKSYTKDITKSCVMGTLSSYQGDRVFDIDCKGSSLSAQGGNNSGGSSNIIFDNDRLRILTPIECERLQGMPDNYTAGLSNGKRYHIMGNGWTVQTIQHLFSGLLTSSKPTVKPHEVVNIQIFKNKQTSICKDTITFDDLGITF